MAVSTEDGSVRPEWQAEPVAAATDGVRASRLSPSWSGKLTFSVFGSRSADVR